MDNFEKSFQYRYTNFPSNEYNPNYIEEIIDAIENKKPYSWVRIGDGELVFLQQEYIYTIQQLKKRVGWSNSTDYCGAKIPNLNLRNRMIESANGSNLVGVFKGDPPMLEAFKKANIKPKSICYAFDNVFLPMNARFVNRVLVKNRLLLVGMKSGYYKQKFQEILNANVVGTVTIKDYAEINSCMDKMCQFDYDVALISAGVNANIICYEMSKKFNRIFLDMGHAWDNAFYPPPKFKEYWLIPVWQENKKYKPNEKVIFENILWQNTSLDNINTIPGVDEKWLKIEDI